MEKVEKYWSEETVTATVLKLSISAALVCRAVIVNKWPNQPDKYILLVFYFVILRGNLSNTQECSWLSPGF